ncbi:MAG: tRNA (guanosine(46)-N7)-methyltransferase TrmB [Anaerovoracaceae bacterium]
MRQRKLRNLEEKLQEKSAMIVSDPASLKGNWRKDPDAPLYVEIGCGKGRFVTDLARRHPDWELVAFEGNESVAYHAMQKAEAAGCGNIRFVLGYVRDIRDFFDKNEADGIFMNFSDPWPKARHAKRRLTAGRHLQEYADVIRPGGTIEFKTDNDSLFEFTEREFRRQDGMAVDYLTYDLHRDVPAEDIIMTEYEEKFSSQGKNINYIRVKIL